MDRRDLCGGRELALTEDSFEPMVKSVCTPPRFQLYRDNLVEKAGCEQLVTDRSQSG